MWTSSLSMRAPLHKLYLVPTIVKSITNAVFVAMPRFTALCFSMFRNCKCRQ